MPKALIVGAGRMGTAIAYGCRQLGMTVTFRDTNTDAIAAAYRKIALLEGMKLIEGENAPLMESEEPNPDVIVSAATYTANLETAKEAVDRKIPYCDLGGHVETSAAIQAYAKEHDGVVFTDLGLAPGLVNIIAEDMYDVVTRLGDTVDLVELRVGGLPSRHSLPSNVLKYAATWSMDGLLNEYMDLCTLLSGGEPLQMPGLSAVERVEWGFPLVFEAFHTSGGLAHTLGTMQQRGVRHVNYKTLRYPGHAQYLKFLFEALDKDVDKIKDALNRMCPPCIDDEVYIYVKVVGRTNELVRKHLVLANKHWSAMQQATAFPVAVVADMMSRGQNLMGYSLIPQCEFKTNLAKLGITL
jgi:saccharopine dehydrogenase-like NADP-dependent oxidoreductase